MKNDKGFIPINRKEIQESKLYPHGKKFSKFEAFLDLLFLAAHSETSFQAGSRCIEVKLKRGQLGYSFVTLADRWKWNIKTVRKFIQEKLKKEENVDSKPYPEKNPVTTIITINSYDHYVRNFENKDTKRDTETDTGTDTFKSKDDSEDVRNIEKVDTETNAEKDIYNVKNDNEDAKNFEKVDTEKDNEKDTETDIFNNYDNYDKNENEHEHENDIPLNNFNRKLSEKEKNLSNDFITWAYDPENNFKIEMSLEKTRELFENTIRKYGYEDTKLIFDYCSKERKAWDKSKTHASAYSDFWKEKVPALKDMKISDRIGIIVELVNEILGTTFDTSDCKNSKKIIIGCPNNNTILKFIEWFKKNGFKDSMTLDDIFTKENWDTFLTSYKSWEKKLNRDSFQTLAKDLPIGLVEKAKKIIAYLNQVTGKNFEDYTIIANGLLSGRTVEEHIKVIDTKKHDSWFVKKGYMCPSTLFGKNFDNYLNEKVKEYANS